MEGIQRARRFWHKVVLPLLKTDLGAFFDEMSVALIGEGSDVLGFDDTISEDHNYWPRLTVFIDDNQYGDFDSQILEQAREQLPSDFEGYTLARNGPYASLSFQPLCEHFRRHLSAVDFPLTTRDWLLTNEQNLAEIVAATVFHDPSGQLQRAIDSVGFYPESIAPFIVVRALERLSEVGGIERSIRRNDRLSANFYFTQFCYYSIRLLHLLNGRYCPYHKWMGRSVCGLKPNGQLLYDLLCEGHRSPNLETYRSVILKAWDVLSETIRSEYPGAVDGAVPGNPLNLLELPGLDHLHSVCRKAIPDELAQIPLCVQPPSYWGLLFDYTGYEVGFSELLTQHLNATRRGR